MQGPQLAAPPRPIPGPETPGTPTPALSGFWTQTRRKAVLAERGEPEAAGSLCSPHISPRLWRGSRNPVLN